MSAETMRGAPTSTTDLVQHLTLNTRRNTKTTRGTPTSMLDFITIGFKTDLDDNAHRARASQGQEAEESRIGLGDNTPQVEALQTRTPRKDGASTTKGTTPPQVTPRTTRIERRDIGNLEADVEMRRMKIFPFLGVAKRLMRSRDTSAISQITREGACPPMLKHMMEQVILMIT